jgi:hypothetical protein
MKYFSRAVVMALFASALSLGGSPANAVTTVDTWAKDASIVGDTCDRTYVNVVGDWDLDTYNVIDVDVRGPGGRRVDGTYRSDEYSGEVTFPVRLCKGNTEGRYSIEVRAEGFDENYESTGVVTAASSFKFAKEPKRNSVVLRDVKYRPAARYDYQVPGRLTRAGRSFERQPVELWARVSGSWYEIDQQRTRNRGKFAWQFKPNRYTWAYVYQGNRTTQWDSSKNFKTPMRNGRVAETTASVDPIEFVRRS